MTAPSLEIQGAINDALTGNSALMALINDVYDSVPKDPWGSKLAYVSFGASDMAPDDADCIEGETHTLQLDVWSRQVGLPHCHRICSAVKAALHLQELEFSDNALVEIELILQRVFRDPDGITAHGAMQFKVTVEAT